MKTDPRVDAYIAKQAAFARPILTALRDMLHEACPDGEETIKWSRPCLAYKGKILAMLSAFKAHASFGYWSGSQVTTESQDAMGQFGRLTSVDDLPPRETLLALTRKAMALIDEGVKPVRNKTVKAPLTVPQDLAAAIEAEPAAKSTWDGFPPSCRREYVEWVTEAKREETRTKRLNETIAMLREGKRRHWKYQDC